MTFLQAFIYFFREAALNLFRSWKISLLAIGTITLSLVLTGVFLIVSLNLRQHVDSWRDESRIVIYLRDDSTAEDLQRVEAFAQTAPQLEEARAISPDEARTRFQAAFPSLADLLVGSSEQPLPPSIELLFDWRALDDQALESWLSASSQDPAIGMIDDDRDWLDQLNAVILVIEGLALALGGILLLTSMFTIASIIRLTAYLYHDEIAVMRLVGATEFFIRGPFYAEGLLQGLLGGFSSTLVLFLGHRVAVQQTSESAPLLGSLLAGSYLSWTHLSALILLGGAAGFLGAVASLRRESLGRTAEPDAWEQEEPTS